MLLHKHICVGHIHMCWRHGLGTSSDPAQVKMAPGWVGWGGMPTISATLEAEIGRIWVLGWPGAKKAGDTIFEK
jgi:hypothetical protein